MQYKKTKPENKILLLLDKIKDFGDNNLPSWIISRRRVLIFIIIDIFISISISLIYKSNLNVFLASILLVWILFSYISHRYKVEKFQNIKRIKYKRKSLKNTFFAFSLTFFYIISVTYFVKDYIILNNQLYLNYKFYSYTIIVISLSFISLLCQYLLRKILSFYDTKDYKLLYYGSEETLNKIKFYSSENNLSIKYIKVDSLKKVLKNNPKFQGLIIEDLKEISKIDLQDLKFIDTKVNQILTIFSWCETFLEKFPTNLLTNEYVLSRNYFRISNLKEYKLKRIGDICLSMILLIFTLPIIALASIAIYIEDRGPIFYSQIRSGYLQKPFKIIKLRTMCIDSEKDGLKWSTKNDKRITKVGIFLRLMRIDELPQLISVLKGEMSLIGPRPERPEIDKYLIEKIPYYELRYSVRPGLSGWAQVNYPYGASEKDAEEKLSYDIFYLANFSFLLDLGIMFKTIKLVLNMRGAIAKH